MNLIIEMKLSGVLAATPYIRLPYPHSSVSVQALVLLWSVGQLDFSDFRVEVTRAFNHLTGLSSRGC
jgi:hypothetical protein